MTTQFSLTRRNFVKHSSTLALAGTMGRRMSFSTDGQADAARQAYAATVDPSVVRSLAMRAIDAAKTAGATYADVRLTRTISAEYTSSLVPGDLAYEGRDTETLGMGVRVLVNGYWGFAATPYWTPDEAVRLAQTAVAQAAENAKGPSRSVDLGHHPIVTGSWTMPIVIDPFQISVEEKLDFLQSTLRAARQILPVYSRIAQGPVYPGREYSLDMVAHCVRQEHALATTEGSYVTQTTFRTSGQMGVWLKGRKNGVTVYSTVPAKGLAEAGRGWEMFAEANVLDQLPALLTAVEVQFAMPSKPVEVGRYDVVCDAVTMANVLDATFGRAAEIDRALGYEANAGGTSYLGPDPMTMLGTAVASDLVTVTADRSHPTGLATVKWDAEGVAPKDFPLVQAGTLVDYMTTREQAAWLAPWYQRHGTPIQSHGCAAAADASGITMQRTPNLTLQPTAEPATGAVDFDALVAGVTDGIAVENGEVRTDFQCRNGIIMPNAEGLRLSQVQKGKGEMRVYQVKRGKRVAELTDAGILFNTTELWKNVTALGGAASLTSVPCREFKGNPEQETAHTARGVPAILKNMATINVTRKA
jgi:TldD protein